MTAWVAGLALGLVAISPDTFAQQSDPPKPPATPAPATTPKPAAPPTLDDLLGIKPSPKPAPTQPDKPDLEPKPDASAPDRDKAELDRALTAEEMGDAFKQAVALMGDASSRLGHKDPGLETQRIQEDAIKRLDQLIASLKQKSSSSSSSKPKPGENSDSQSDPGKQGENKPGGPSQPQPPQGAPGNSPGMGPTLQEGTLAPQLESARAAWGSLPARVREMLMQGTEDRFSARYKLLTQEYYKRLAEENTK